MPNGCLATFDPFSSNEAWEIAFGIPRGRMLWKSRQTFDIGDGDMRHLVGQPVRELVNGDVELQVCGCPGISSIIARPVQDVFNLDPTDNTGNVIMMGAVGHMPIPTVSCLDIEWPRFVRLFRPCAIGYDVTGRTYRRTRHTSNLGRVTVTVENSVAEFVGCIMSQGFPRAAYSTPPPVATYSLRRTASMIEMVASNTILDHVTPTSITHDLIYANIATIPAPNPTNAIWEGETELHRPDGVTGESATLSVDGGPPTECSVDFCNQGFYHNGSHPAYENAC